MKAHIILYVKDQKKSSTFYHEVLNQNPALNVDGMTEFSLNEGAVLGLMPEKGIKHLLGDAIQNPALAKGIPRAELYLIVDEPEVFFQRAVDAGAKMLSPFELRNWGDSAAYCQDPDGHILAFAKNLQKNKSHSHTRAKS